MSADAAGRTYFDLRRSLLPAVGLPRDFLGGQVITDEHSALLADAGTRELIEQDTTPIEADAERNFKRPSGPRPSTTLDTRNRHYGEPKLRGRAARMAPTPAFTAV